MDCHLCSSTLKSGRLLKRHFAYAHPKAPAAEWWRMNETIKYKADAASMPQRLCDAEASFVAPGKDPSMYYCIDCGSEFTKKNCTRHFAVVHQLDSTVTRNWIVMKDRNLLKRSWTRTHLERYFTDQSGDARDDDDGDDDDDDADDDHDDDGDLYAEPMQVQDEQSVDMDLTDATTHPPPQHAESAVQTTLQRKPGLFMEHQYTGDVARPMFPDLVHPTPHHHHSLQTTLPLQPGLFMGQPYDGIVAGPSSTSTSLSSTLEAQFADLRTLLQPKTIKFAVQELRITDKAREYTPSSSELKQTRMSYPFVHNSQKWYIQQLEDYKMFLQSSQLKANRHSSCFMTCNDKL